MFGKYMIGVVELLDSIEKRIYSFGDIKNFPQEEKWELIDGVPHQQAQGTFEHQEIILKIGAQIINYLHGKPCRVAAEPAVWLEKMADSAKDYVVPDIVVVCDPQKIISGGIVGTPDMIVEIVSPLTENWDRINKLRRYRLAGVREYWIVDPDGSVAVHTLSNGTYIIEPYAEGKVKVGIFPDLEIDLDLVFSAKPKAKIRVNSSTPAKEEECDHRAGQTGPD
jgi:Uma2 family endonuclease